MNADRLFFGNTLEPDIVQGLAAGCEYIYVEGKLGRQLFWQVYQKAVCHCQ